MFELNGYAAIVTGGASGIGQETARALAAAGAAVTLAVRDEEAGQRAAEHGEVLAEDEDQSTVYRAIAGHDAVAREFLRIHAEIVAAVFDELVPFFEAAGVEQQLDTLAGGELAFLVLLLDTVQPSAQASGGFLLHEQGYVLLHGVNPVG